MIAYVLEVVIAVAVSYWLADLRWWAPLVAFPLIMRVSNAFYEPPQFAIRSRIITDTLIMLTQIGWIIGSIAICVQGLHSWWGVVLGLPVAWLGWAALTPRRWAAEVRAGV